MCCFVLSTVVLCGFPYNSGEDSEGKAVDIKGAWRIVRCLLLFLCGSVVGTVILDQVQVCKSLS